MNLAEKVTSRIGSWMFLNIQTIALALWIAWNAFLCTLVGLRPFDPFPFVFLNLTLSFQAAYTGPIVLMAQYAQAKRDAKRDGKMEQMTEAILTLAQRADERDEIIFETLQEQTKMIVHLSNIIRKQKEE